MSQQHLTTEEYNAILQSLQSDPQWNLLSQSVRDKALEALGEDLANDIVDHHTEKVMEARKPKKKRAPRKKKDDVGGEPSQ